MAAAVGHVRVSAAVELVPTAAAAVGQVSATTAVELVPTAAAAVGQVSATTAVELVPAVAAAVGLMVPVADAVRLCLQLLLLLLGLVSPGAVGLVLPLVLVVNDVSE